MNSIDNYFVKFKLPKYEYSVQFIESSTFVEQEWQSVLKGKLWPVGAKRYYFGSHNKKLKSDDIEQAYRSKYIDTRWNIFMYKIGLIDAVWKDLQVKILDVRWIKDSRVI